MKTIFLALLCCSAAHAQILFSIPQHAETSGGGRSSGGPFTLRGSIGQAVTAPPADASPSPSAGFWAWNGSDEPRMDLTIGGTMAVLSWPYLLPDDVSLEWSGDISLWHAYPTPAGLQLTESTGARRLYRLRIR